MDPHSFIKPLRSVLNCPTHMWKSKPGRMQDVHCRTATLSGTGAFSWERDMLAEDISHHLISLLEHLLSGFLNRSCNEVKSTPLFMPSIHSRPEKKATLYVWIAGVHRIQVGFWSEGCDPCSGQVWARKGRFTRWQLE